MLVGLLLDFRWNCLGTLLEFQWILGSRWISVGCLLGVGCIVGFSLEFPWTVLGISVGSRLPLNLRDFRSMFVGHVLGFSWLLDSRWISAIFVKFSLDPYLDFRWSSLGLFLEFRWILDTRWIFQISVRFSLDPCFGFNGFLIPHWIFAGVSWDAR